jgi:hypothetical protein
MHQYPVTGAPVPCASCGSAVASRLPDGSVLVEHGGRQQHVFPGQVEVIRFRTTCAARVRRAACPDGFVPFGPCGAATWLTIAPRPEANALLTADDARGRSRPRTRPRRVAPG